MRLTDEISEEDKRAMLAENINGGCAERDHQRNWDDLATPGTDCGRHLPRRPTDPRPADPGLAVLLG
jgi:hypothetical protein